MAQSGNGIDIAAVYRLLTEMAETMRGQGDRLEAVEHKLNEVVITVNEHSRRFDQVAAVLNEHGRKLDDLAHDVRGLRGTVGEYHHAVVGHGVSLNRLEERVNALEIRLGIDDEA